MFSPSSAKRRASDKDLTVLKLFNNLNYSTLESSDAIPSSIQFRQYLYSSSRVKLRAIYLQRSMFRLTRKSNLNPQVGVAYLHTYV